MSTKPRQLDVFCACVAFLAQRAFSPALIYLARWGVVRKRYDQCVYQEFYSSFQSSIFFSNSRNYSLKLPSVKFLFQSYSAFSRAHQIHCPESAGHPASVPLCILQFPLLLIITLLISVFSLSRDPWHLRIQRTISLNLAVLGAAGLNLVL